jgi:hypothetical protein
MKIRTVIFNAVLKVVTSVSEECAVPMNPKSLNAMRLHRHAKT